MEGELQPNEVVVIVPRHRRWGVSLIVLCALIVAGVFGLRPLVRDGSGPAIVIRPAMAIAQAGAPAEAQWREIDREIADALATARLRSLAAARLKVDGLVFDTARRVDDDFLPWYLSFARRKLEELKAYNYFAMDKVYTLATGEPRDTSTPALMATFEEQFVERVLRPSVSHQALRNLALETAENYGRAAALEFRGIQKRHNIAFPEWTDHLDHLPPVSFLGSDNRPVPLPLAALTNPGPALLSLGAALGDSLVARFDRLPSILDRAQGLVTPAGESIFMVGQNAGLYFASYLVYWAVLIFLVQSGFIPINLFGALVGWLIWEALAWGSWIGMEALNYGQAQQEIGTVVHAHAVAYFDQVRTVLGDVGLLGPFKILHQIERTLP